MYTTPKINKITGQRQQALKPSPLAFAFVGSWQSRRMRPPYKRLTAQPFAGSSPALPASSTSPTGSCNYPWGVSSGRSQRTGLSTSILADRPLEGKAKMTCHSCSVDCVKAGKYGRKRVQRYLCNQCVKRYSEPRDKPLGDVRLPDEKSYSSFTASWKATPFAAPRGCAMLRREPFSTS